MTCLFTVMYCVFLYWLESMTILTLRLFHRVRVGQYDNVIYHEIMILRLIYNLSLS